MDIKKIIIIGLFLSLLFSGLSMSNTGALNQAKNYISMTVNEKVYNFTKNTGAFVKYSDTDKTQIIMGVVDPDLKAELIITANCQKDQELNEINLSSENDQIMIIFKSAYNSFVISPSIRLASGDNEYEIHKSILKNGSGSVFKKTKPAWTTMTKAKRMATGKGIIHNKELDGTSFVLNIKPTIKEGRVAELVGSFSGKARGADSFQPGSFINILNGKFQVEVKTDEKIK